MARRWWQQRLTRDAIGVGVDEERPEQRQQDEESQDTDADQHFWILAQHPPEILQRRVEARWHLLWRLLYFDNGSCFNGCHECLPLSLPHARIKGHITEIGQEVRRQHRERNEQEDCLQQSIVRRLHGL